MYYFYTSLNWNWKGAREIDPNSWLHFSKMKQDVYFFCCLGDRFKVFIRELDFNLREAFQPHWSVMTALLLMLSNNGNQGSTSTIHPRHGCYVTVDKHVREGGKFLGTFLMRLS